MKKSPRAVFLKSLKLKKNTSSDRKKVHQFFRALELWETSWVFKALNFFSGFEKVNKIKCKKAYFALFFNILTKAKFVHTHY